MILPKVIYILNIITIRILTQFFPDVERTILRFMWKTKKNQLFTLKEHLQVSLFLILSSTTGIGMQNREVHKWNGIEVPDITPHTYGH